MPLSANLLIQMMAQRRKTRSSLFVSMCSRCGSSGGREGKKEREAKREAASTSREKSLSSTPTDHEWDTQIEDIESLQVPEMLTLSPQ